MKLVTSIAFMFLLNAMPPSRPCLVRQPKEKVWVMLVKTLQQDSMCLSVASTQDPMLMCLVGVPLQPNEYPFAGKKPNPVNSWDAWTRILLHAPEEPQELHLLRSPKASFCIRFGYTLTTPEWLESAPHRRFPFRDVNPTKRMYDAADWCNYISEALSKSTKNPRVLPVECF